MTTEDHVGRISWNKEEEKSGITSPFSQFTHTAMLGLHVHALACHCECLGMNAENSWAVCNNSVPPYNNTHYSEVMRKWGLINDKGEPTI